MSDDTLDANEKAKKYNLIGVIKFSDLNFDKAIESFTISFNLCQND